MGKRNLAELRITTAADKGNVTNRVVRRTVRSF
jgi:hypothetical protein